MASPTDRTILVVEDEPAQAMKLQLVLQENGHRASVTGSAEEALAMMGATVPDLVVSDIVMPGMDGYTFCERIRTDGRFAGVRVILLTSQADPRDVVKGLASGADGFVAKPFDVNELLENVNRVLALQANHTQERALTPLRTLLDGEEFEIRSSRTQILNFFISAYEGTVRRARELGKAHQELKSLASSLERAVDERTAALSAEIVDRKRAEHESRERAALLDKAQDAILVCDLSHHIIYWNKSAERLYGWSADEGVGRRMEDLLHDEANPTPAGSDEPLRSGGEWTGEITQRTRTGRQVIVQSRWTLVRDEAGQPRSILIINTDITEKKSLEQQFLRTQRLESIGTLAGGIAHDLNNLLAPILLAIDILRQQSADPKGERTISLIESSARRAADMVKQVLTFARGVEGDRLLLQPAHLIKEMSKIAEQSFPKSIEFGVSCPRDLRPVMGDATQLHQVLMNLCVNARDAMPNGGSIAIKAENIDIDENYAAMNPEAKPGPYVLIRVKDSGTGMPPSVLEKIFEPFFTTKEVGKGTGLGLSTVLAIVRSHEGFVRVDSAPGDGTEFRIFLPATTAQEGREAEHGRVLSSSGHGELIMVVDDERVIREITRATLEGHGYRVVDAGDGTEALAVYAQHAGEVRAVILDMIMPYLDGPSTIRALLKMDPGACIIGVSGLNETVKAAESASRRTIPFLPKPYTTEQLLTILERTLKFRETHETIQSTVSGT